MNLGLVSPGWGIENTQYKHKPSHKLFLKSNQSNNNHDIIPKLRETIINRKIVQLHFFIYLNPEGLAC